MTIKHCCEKMTYYVNDSDGYGIVEYSPETRYYYFPLYGSNAGTHLSFGHCPWCGNKLPKSLGEEWCAVVKNDLGIEDVDFEQWAKLPEKYKTEQWWRERGI